MFKYKLVCFGGTFNGIHAGHEALIKKAFEAGEFVVVGLTTDSYAGMKSDSVKKFDERKADLENYFNNSGFAGRYKIMPLSEPYGITLTERKLEAIVVSDETLRSAMEINKLRRAMGMSDLEIVKIDTVYDKNLKKISSSNR